MKVILISSVSGLGTVGDVVEVKNGYGRNFLIPSKKAISFNKINNKIFSEKRKHFEEENQKNIESASGIKRSIAGQNIIIVENASDDGRLYGSVTSTIIAAKINSLIKENILQRSHIFLQNQIKEIGIFKAKVALHPDAEFDVQIVVCRDESEVEDMIKAKKEAEKSEKNKALEEEKLLKSFADKNSEDEVAEATSSDQA